MNRYKIHEMLQQEAHTYDTNEIQELELDTGDQDFESCKPNVSEMLPDTYTMPGSHPDLFTPLLTPMRAPTIDANVRREDSSDVLISDAEKLYFDVLISLYEAAISAWYATPGIILFAVMSTHMISTFHLSFAYTLVILALCGSSYSTALNRMRRRLAHNSLREGSRRGKEGIGLESVEWLNGFWERYWKMYEPVLSLQILESVNSVLPNCTPAFLDNLSIASLTLGNKAPRMDNVRIYPNTPPETVVLDCNVSFIPSDIMDITPRQAQTRTNPKAVLAARLGKAGLGPSLPILLEDLEFTGKMRIKLKLMPPYPHIKTLSLSFLEEPFIDYTLKPLGSGFGFDINVIPGLSAFIRGRIHTSLGGMMYYPNYYTMDFSGVSSDQAIGVLRLTIKDAQGLRAIKFGGGDPDPYVSIELGSKVGKNIRTRAIHSTTNPSWNETHFILVHNLDDTLNLGVWDYNTHRADNQLGNVEQKLSVLAENAELYGLTARINGSGKDRGRLRYDLAFYPVVPPMEGDTSRPDIFASHIRSGIVRLCIHGAQGIEGRGRTSLSTYAQVLLDGNHEPIHKTDVRKRSSEPDWDSHCEYFLMDKQASTITVQIINTKDTTGDPVIGKIVTTLSDLLDFPSDADVWLSLQGPGPGKIRLTATFHPTPMNHVSGSAAYIPPIGILRIHLKSARDVKNVEIAHGGKSDPYVRILGKNGTVIARTEVRDSTLDPDWDEIVYVPVHSLKEGVVLEVMDYQIIGKDRPLGGVEVRMTDLAEEDHQPGVDRHAYKGRGRQERSGKIRLDKEGSFKGILNYTAEFFPSMPMCGGASFWRTKQGSERLATTISVPLTSAACSETTTHELPCSPYMGTTPTAMSALNLALSESTSGFQGMDAEHHEHGSCSTREELLSKKSGLLVVHLISGTLSRSGTIEILIDDDSWPSFTSSRARSNHQKWDEVGEGFIRELDYSRIWLRANGSEEADREEIIAELRCDTRDFLDACLDGPADFRLLSPVGSHSCTLRMSARYVPVDIDLEPRESIHNMGVLRCVILRAKHLLAVDRGGKSDPNVTFSLNGVKVYKTETKKKTLHPEWNESFEVMIPSRVKARLEFDINDWDLVGPANYMGSGVVDLSRLEPFREIEMACPITHERKGHHGTLTVKLMFQPEIIARTRNRSSTFATAGRAITQVGGLPIAAGKGVLVSGGVVAMGVGRGVGTVGGFAGRKFGLIKKRSKSERQVLAETDQSDLLSWPSEVTLGDEYDEYTSVRSLGSYEDQDA